MKDYSFDGTISKEVLCNYLERSVTAADLYLSDTLEDDIRVIKKIGAKFLGRASGIWYVIMDDDKHFEMSKALADRVHAADPEIILQACVFEAVFKELNDIKIPAYVFEAFGLKPEDRNFRLSDILFTEQPHGFSWDGDDGGIPDITRLETKMWFYYRATRYIDCGYEALHMGQVHLYTANDRGYAETYKLFDMIREFAKTHARRHKVLLDAHTHGVNVGGKLLFDYHAMPFTRFALRDRPGDKLVLVREGFSEGGLNPNGWSANTMPYLMEYDNWGGKMIDDFSTVSVEDRAGMDWWGYDQIAWFANQDKESRDKFLEYTYKWVAVNNKNAYFEVPFCRRLSSAKMIVKRADNGEYGIQGRYQINNPSAACPMGFGQEDTVERLWREGDDNLRNNMSNPEDLIRYGAFDKYDIKTGLKLPEKIVLYGSFQPFVGAALNDSNSEITRMYYIGDNTYSLSFIMPYAGEYNFAVSLYGTLSATYCHDRFPRSGSTHKRILTVPHDNTAVKITYRFIDNEINVETD